MIKKLSLILCVVMLFSFAGCRNEKKVSSDSSSIPVESSILSSEESVLKDTKSKSDTSSDTVTGESNTSDEIEQASVPEKTDTTVSESKPETKPTESVQSTSSIAPSSTEEKNESNVSSAPPIPNATAADSKEIASLIAKYINEYRNKCDVENAVVLPGLTEYAEYRSRQLISNFSHDTDDERAAATALKYGRYIEPSLYGMTGEPYYVACSGEAIVKAGYAGSKEYIAESIATLVANSIAHWTYVGHPANKYIAVGVTYESGLWYCDIAVSDVNYDETS